MGTLAQRQVAHVWRRLGFGPTAADLDHGVTVGPAALVDSLLNRTLTTRTQWRFPTPTTWEGQVKYLGRQFHLMSTSPNPLQEQERLAWILQGLVVVGWVDSVGVVDYRNHLARLRANPFGSYTKLLHDTATMPAMLLYLNGDQNSASHPNQNYARELMELFSLGLTNPLTGARNYSQCDVVQVARAVTGYTFDWNHDKVGFDQSQFDHGTKTFLGKPRGKAGLAQVIAAISEHPSYRYFVPARLHRELTGLQPSPRRLQELGALWGTTGDVRAVVENIAHSPTFLSPAAMGSRLKTPVELLISGARVMKFDLGPTDYGWQLSTFMNQHPFFPPNVSGWPTGKIWLNSGVTMAWGSIVQEFATASLANKGGGVTTELFKVPRAQAAQSAVHLCGLSDVSRPTAKALTRYVDAGPWTRERAAGLLALVLVSPEFAVN